MTTTLQFMFCFFHELIRPIIECENGKQGRGKETTMLSQSNRYHVHANGRIGLMGKRTSPESEYTHDSAYNGTLLIVCDVQACVNCVNFTEKNECLHRLDTRPFCKQSTRLSSEIRTMPKHSPSDTHFFTAFPRQFMVFIEVKVFIRLFHCFS
jgi:hypothetical protein